MKKALSYSVACRFEGMLRRVLHALAEEADGGATQSWTSLDLFSFSYMYMHMYMHMYP